MVEQMTETTDRLKTRMNSSQKNHSLLERKYQSIINNLRLKQHNNPSSKDKHDEKRSAPFINVFSTIIDLSGSCVVAFVVAFVVVVVAVVSAVVVEVVVVVAAAVVTSVVVSVDSVVVLVVDRSSAGPAVGTHVIVPIINQLQ